MLADYQIFSRRVNFNRPPIPDASFSGPLFRKVGHFAQSFFHFEAVRLQGLSPDVGRDEKRRIVPIPDGRKGINQQKLTPAFTEDILPLPPGADLEDRISGFTGQRDNADFGDPARRPRPVAGARAGPLRVASR